MPFTIIKAAEQIDVKNIVVLIYGQPGVGKSSIAFTSSQDRVLTLDFDNGAHRSAFRKDTLRINSWAEVQDLLKDADTLSGYDTIVVDTVGRCLDFIIGTFDRSTNKLVTRAGNPTMQGWGELKAIFQTFVRTLTLLGKDIILVAHEKEEKKGDSTIVRPDVSGGSYAEVFKISDFVGRLFKLGKTTTLDFEPCEEYLGKNSAALKAIDVPDFALHPTFLGDLLSRMKDALGKNTAAQKEAVDKLEQYRASIMSCESAEDLNQILSAAKAEPDTLKKQIKSLTDDQGKKVNATFDKDTRRYVASEARAKTNGKPSAVIANGKANGTVSKKEEPPPLPPQEDPQDEPLPAQEEVPAPEKGVDEDDW